MNAHQRRKDRRRWRYRVVIEFQGDYKKYIEMWQWCYDNFSPYTNHRWREEHHNIGGVWQFEKDKDAMAFSLKWL